MKKFFAILLCLLLCAAAVGCGNDPTEPFSPSGSTNPSVPSDPTDPTEPTLPLDAPTEVVGKWRLNETLTPPTFKGETYEHGIAFKAFLHDGCIYGTMHLKATNGDPISFTLVYGPTTAYDSATNTWLHDRFRTLDFGENPQTLDRDFYIWFIANATPVE